MRNHLTPTGIDILQSHTLHYADDNCNAIILVYFVLNLVIIQLYLFEINGVLFCFIHVCLCCTLLLLLIMVIIEKF
jgi:hypothetical protein